MPAVAVMAWALLAAPAARAFDDRSAGIYVEGGVAPHTQGNTDALSIGVQLPWLPDHAFRGVPTPLYWDLFASNWCAPSKDGGHRNYAQIGAIAVLRYRLGDGRSPWFAEVGIGGSLTDRIYRSTSHDFSTEFQFTEVLGLGYSFDAPGRFELSLRAQHFSNADIKKPNPGETFIRLRGAYHF